MIKREGKHGPEYRQIPSLRKMNPLPVDTLRPETAERYGITDGEWIFIETKRGPITRRARVTDSMKPGVVNCQIGWRFPERKEKQFPLKEIMVWH